MERVPGDDSFAAHVARMFKQTAHRAAEGVLADEAAAFAFTTCMSRKSPPVVAILNSNDDTVEMLRAMLESEGIVGVSAHVADLRRGEFDFSGFLAEHDPQVIIYDIPPPYDRSWLFLEHLRGMPVMDGRRFVLTSTNPTRVQQVAQPGEPILEIIGKPYDLQIIIDAVKKELESESATTPGRGN